MHTAKKLIILKMLYLLKPKISIKYISFSHMCENLMSHLYKVAENVISFVFAKSEFGPFTNDSRIARGFMYVYTSKFDHFLNKPNLYYSRNIDNNLKKQPFFSHKGKYMVLCFTIFVCGCGDI